MPHAARNMLAARSGNDTSGKVTLFYSITLLPLLVSFNVEDSQTQIYFGRSGDRGWDWDRDCLSWHVVGPTQSGCYFPHSLIKPITRWHGKQSRWCKHSVRLSCSVLVAPSCHGFHALAATMLRKQALNNLSFTVPKNRKVDTTSQYYVWVQPLTST